MEKRKIIFYVKEGENIVPHEYITEDSLLMSHFSFARNAGGKETWYFKINFEFASALGTREKRLFHFFQDYLEFKNIDRVEAYDYIQIPLDRDDINEEKEGEKEEEILIFESAPFGFEIERVTYTEGYSSVEKTFLVSLITEFQGGNINGNNQG